MHRAEGYEADDLIATYTEQAVSAGATVTIVASDKDLMQLVGAGVEMYDSMRDRRIGTRGVREIRGRSLACRRRAGAGRRLHRQRPGVPGIGVKTAPADHRIWRPRNAAARASEIKQPKRRENLIEFADQARLSRKLVELKRDVPLDVPLAELAVRDPDPERLVAFLKAMEFTTITRASPRPRASMPTRSRPAGDCRAWGCAAPTAADCEDAAEEGAGSRRSTAGDSMGTPERLVAATRCARRPRTGRPLGL
jgi:DNA polymerase I